MTNCVEITVTRKPGPRPNVTGAALRSVEAADAAADAAYATLEEAASRLSELLCVKNPNATDLANAVSALIAFNDAKAVVLGLVPRHQWYRATLRQYWPISGVMASQTDPVEAVKEAGIRLHKTLKDAGVPMGGLPSRTNSIEWVEYWQDAAARGC